MSLRNDFPIFKHNPNLVYLDSASSTQKPQFVIDKTSEYIASSYANIGRGSYALAEQSDTIYFWTKAAIAKLLGAANSEIIFTPNSTYAINTFALSLLASDYFTSGDEIILSIAEHHANILVREQIAVRHWLTIVWIGLTEQLLLNIEELESKLSSKTKLVSLTLCSNILGIKNDLTKIRKIIWPDVLFLVDASQAVPNYSVDVKVLDCDALVFSAHKFLAYTGLGILYIKKSLLSRLKPWLFGWGTVDDVSTEGFTLRPETERFEPGTPNIISIVSFYYAMQYRESIGWYTWRDKYEQKLIEQVSDRIHALSDRIYLVNPGEDKIGIFSLLPKAKSLTIQSIVDHMNKNNICIRGGGHCAYPLSKQLWLHNGSIRLSLYIYNTAEDIDLFFDSLKAIL